MTRPILSAQAQLEIKRIAQEVLSLDTLEVRNQDSQDFHDLHVSTIRRALEAAYLAGALRLAGLAEQEN